MSANRLSSRISCVLAYKSSAMPSSKMYFCAGCISGPSASMRSRTDLLIGSGVITAVIVWPPFASFGRARDRFFCADGAGTGAADRLGSNIAARESVTRYASLADSPGRSGGARGTDSPGPPFASSPFAFSFAFSSVSRLFAVSTASPAEHARDARDPGDTQVFAAAAATTCARARASSAARSSSGDEPPFLAVASSRFSRPSSAGLEAVAGPAEGLGVGERALSASTTAGADVSGVSGTADDAGEPKPIGGVASSFVSPPTGDVATGTSNVVSFLSTSSANASKSYGSTVTSTRSAPRSFPGVLSARDSEDGRSAEEAPSSASGLILRASAISSSCSSGSASRRLRLVFGGITGVSGAFRAARRRSSAPLVAAANPPTTLLVSEPRFDRLSRSERFFFVADRSSPCASRSAQSTTRATWPGAP